VTVQAGKEEEEVREKDVPGSHPAVILVGEPFHDVLDFQSFLVLGDGVLVLVLGGQDRDRDGDLRSVFRH
jgi:hypothetical protein